MNRSATTKESGVSLNWLDKGNNHMLGLMSSHFDAKLVTNLKTLGPTPIDVGFGTHRVPSPLSAGQSGTWRSRRAATSQARSQRPQRQKEALILLRTNMVTYSKRMVPPVRTPTYTLQTPAARSAVLAIAHSVSSGWMRSTHWQTRFSRSLDGRSQR